MIFQIAFMSLSPYADKPLFFLRQGKTGDKIIPMSDISATHFFKYCFLHNRFHLSYRSLSIDFFLTSHISHLGGRIGTQFIIPHRMIEDSGQLIVQCFQIGL